MVIAILDHLISGKSFVTTGHPLLRQEQGPQGPIKALCVCVCVCVCVRVRVRVCVCVWSGSMGTIVSLCQGLWTEHWPGLVCSQPAPHTSLEAALVLNYSLPQIMGVWYPADFDWLGQYFFRSQSMGSVCSHSFRHLFTPCCIFRPYVLFLEPHKHMWNFIFTFFCYEGFLYKLMLFPLWGH